MTPQSISLIVTIVCVVVAGLGFLRGFFKGVAKSGVDIAFTTVGTILTSVITWSCTSLLMSKEVLNSLLGFLKGQFYSEDVQNYLTMAQDYINENPNAQDLANTVVAIPAIILTPLVFIIVYFCVGLILKIPRALIEWLLFSKAKGLVSKLTGGAVCALRYFIVFVTVMIPLVGYLNFATTAIDAYADDSAPETLSESMEEQAPGDIRDSEAMQYVYAIRDGGFAKTIYDLGGRAVFNSLTSVTIDGVQLSLEKETTGAIKLYKAVIPLVKSPLEYTETEISALDDVNKTLEESEFLPLLLSKAVSFASGELYENGEIVGYSIPSLGDAFDPTVKRVLEILSDTDSVQLRKDLVTLSGIAGCAIENGVLEELTKEEKDIMGLVQNDKLISGVLVELYRNERTRNALPYISNALSNYVCRIYNDINGTSLTPEEFDTESFTEENISKEGAIIKNVIVEIQQFISSIGNLEDVQELAVNADLESLGESMEHARDSIIVGRSYKILFYAFLHSEKCAEFGVVDDEFIENATKENADISQMLAARQTLMRLVLSLQSVGTEGAKQEMLHSVLESMMTDDSESIKSLVNRENLISMGIPYTSADTINQVVNSMLDSFGGIEFEDEEHKKEELEKTEAVINVLSSAAANNEQENVFRVGSLEQSKTSMSAKDFVETVTDSAVASEMLQSAVVDENGEAKDDPFHIQDDLTDRDKQQITNALNDSYSAEGITDDQKATLEALAQAFGVTITK